MPTISAARPCLGTRAAATARSVIAWVVLPLSTRLRIQKPFGSALRSIPDVGRRGFEVQSRDNADAACRPSRAASARSCRCAVMIVRASAFSASSSTLVRQPSRADDRARHHREANRGAVLAIDELAADVVQRREGQRVQVDEDEVGPARPPSARRSRRRAAWLSPRPRTGSRGSRGAVGQLRYSGSVIFWMSRHLGDRPHVVRVVRHGLVGSQAHGDAMVPHAAEGHYAAAELEVADGVVRHRAAARGHRPMSASSTQIAWTPCIARRGAQARGHAGRATCRAVSCPKTRCSRVSRMWMTKGRSMRLAERRIGPGSSCPLRAAGRSRRRRRGCGPRASVPAADEVLVAGEQFALVRDRRGIEAGPDVIWNVVWEKGYLESSGTFGWSSVTVARMPLSA